jgi:hypothetical protein
VVEAEAVAEAVAEAPKNMPLLLPLCFKVTIRILAEFYLLEVIFIRFCLMFI